jgi:hypothetical protein
MKYKLIYQDGTVKDSDWVPDNFTGTVEWADGSKKYLVNGLYHRDGGLPSYDGADGRQVYYVNDKRTGQFWHTPKHTLLLMSIFPFAAFLCILLIKCCQQPG